MRQEQVLHLKEAACSEGLTYCVEDSSEKRDVRRLTGIWIRQEMKQSRQNGLSDAPPDASSAIELRRMRG